MKRIVVLCLSLTMILFVSCNRPGSYEAVAIDEKMVENDSVASPPTIGLQFPGFPDRNPESEFYLGVIGAEFFGVFLPVEYITALKNTRNHSLSMHRNNRGSHDVPHDVLAVFSNRIFSNLRFHDRYAIRASEGNLFQFVIEDGEQKIIDNNEYLYKKIGADPNNYHNIVRSFAASIILENLLAKQIRISTDNGRLYIPQLKDITGEDTFLINLSDMFFERGLNLLLMSTNPDNRFNVALIIDGSNYYFYRIESSWDDDYFERAEPILYFSIE